MYRLLRILSSCVPGRAALSWLVAGIAGIAPSLSAQTRPEWTTAAAMPTARVCLGVAEADGKLYAIGGGRIVGGVWENCDRVEMFDPRRNTWTPRRAIPTTRGSFGIATVDGKIYVLGGVLVADGLERDLATVEVYDPRTDTWTKRRSMPTPRSQVGAAVVDGKIYAIGGKNSESTVEEYDPATDAWRSRATAKFRIRNAGVVAVGGRIYVIGGHRLGGNAVLEYDPRADSWRERSRMPTPRTDLALAVCNERIHVFGGHGHLRANEAYDPATDTWRAGQPMPTMRGYLAAATVDAKIYVIGGALEIMRGNELGLVEVYDPSGEP